LVEKSTKVRNEIKSSTQEEYIEKQTDRRIIRKDIIMDLLPNELMVEIVKLLDVKDRMNFCIAYKRAQGICKITEKNWGRVKIYSKNRISQYKRDNIHGLIVGPKYDIYEVIQRVGDIDSLNYIEIICEYGDNLPKNLCDMLGDNIEHLTICTDKISAKTIRRLTKNNKLRSLQIYTDDLKKYPIKIDKFGKELRGLIISKPVDHLDIAWYYCYINESIYGLQFIEIDCKNVYITNNAVKKHIKEIQHLYCNNKIEDVDYNTGQFMDKYNLIRRNL
jgi:hypothetical protein